MSEYDHFPKAFLPITQRILLSFAKTLNEERARAVEEGLPGDIVLEGTLNTLLWFAARVAVTRGQRDDIPRPDGVTRAPVHQDGLAVAPGRVLRREFPGGTEEGFHRGVSVSGGRDLLCSGGSRVWYSGRAHALPPSPVGGL